MRSTRDIFNDIQTLISLGKDKQAIKQFNQHKERLLLSPYHAMKMDITLKVLLCYGRRQKNIMQNLCDSMKLYQFAMDRLKNIDIHKDATLYSIYNKLIYDYAPQEEKFWKMLHNMLEDIIQNGSSMNNILKLVSFVDFSIEMTKVSSVKRSLSLSNLNEYKNKLSAIISNTQSPVSSKRKVTESEESDVTNDETTLDMLDVKRQRTTTKQSRRVSFATQPEDEYTSSIEESTVPLVSIMKESAAPLTSVGFFAVKSTQENKIYQFIYGVEKIWSKDEAADLLRGLGRYCEYIYFEHYQETMIKRIGKSILLTIDLLYKLATTWGDDNADRYRRNLYKAYPELQHYFEVNEKYRGHPIVLPEFSQENFKRIIKDTILELKTYFGEKQTAGHILSYLSQKAALAPILASFYGLKNLSLRLDNEITKQHRGQTPCGC